MQDFWKRLVKALKLLTNYNPPVPTTDQRKEELKEVFAQLTKSFPEFIGKLIIEDGKFNYNFDDKGTLLKIDFSFPEIGLFIILGDIYTASKSTAELYGISPEELIQARNEAALVTNFFARLKKNEDISFIYLPWDEPLTYTAILSKLRSSGVING